MLDTRYYALCDGCSWCGPCKLLGPRLENIVAEQLGSIIMVKVDIDEHTDLALEYGVSGALFLWFFDHPIL